MSLLLVVRVRGAVNATEQASYTLSLLRLRRPYTASLVRASPSVLGMLKRVERYVMWSEADEEMVSLLLERRAQTRGGKPLTQDTVKQWGYRDIKDLARALLEGKVELAKLDTLKPFFALHPPRGGYRRSIKKLYEEGGVLGKNPQLKKLLPKMV
ncbi:MAG: 50S ribosomal protein L30 [Nitrososphaerota archaeon]